jgi:hypothetical protein
MHSSAWVALLKHIPPEHHNRLMLVTSGGTEIAIQCFLRVEPELLALRGRLAGSQDTGRVFFVPYANIDYFGFGQEVKESEFHQLFNGLVLPEVPARIAAPVDDEPARAGAPDPQPGSGPRPAIRSEVLERFRSNRPGSSSNLPRPARNGAD